MLLRTRPASSEYLPYYTKYIERVPEGDLLATLTAQHEESAALIRGIGEERGDHRYGPDKWSIREVLGHMSDTERIMAYRALCVARGDTTPLPGFDENAYVARASFGARTLGSLLDELRLVREATLALYRPMTDSELLRIGSANGAAITPRALAWIIAGHERHHVSILRERYL